MTLTPEHAAYLEAHAVDLAVAERAGVFSVANVDELPGEFRWYGEAAVPAIVFPWRSPIGTEVLQLRPDRPVVIDGEERKYLLAKGAPSVLNAIIPTGDVVLLCEGTKQHLAAASYAGPRFAVYGMMGCSQWMDDGIPIPDLMVVENKVVIVSFDADVAANVNVWTAADKLTDALRFEAANEVKFVRLPAGKKAGLDDLLASRPPEKRSTYLARLLDEAGKLPPKPRGKATNGVDPLVPALGRARIVVNRDQLMVINDITDALVTRFNGTRLFNHGGIISELIGHEVRPVDKGRFLSILQEAALTVHAGQNGDVPTWPAMNAIAAALSHGEHYIPLDRITRVPFVREDGTICSTPGYDPETAAFLLWDGPPIEVPEAPTDDDVRRARALLMEEWLGDFPFLSEADRANALALAVTPVIRGLVPLAPLAVIDGLQMGVGKNLLANCVTTVFTGEILDPLQYTTDNEELRKLITSTFRRGADVICLDEAHELAGTALARALTAVTYADRILGVSVMAYFPNRVTWIALGNRVEIKGDMARRVYPIQLHPTMANPESRPASSFRHPDLSAWTRQHRRELLTAALTLVRAWFAAGCPEHERGGSFGSFEAWGRMVGGIVELAGLKGFLENISTWRSERDFDRTYWLAHLRWLWETFGTAPFACSDVRFRLMAKPDTAEPPPGLVDPTVSGYPRVLGQAYARQREKIVDGYVLRRSPVSGHNNVNKWLVERLGGDDGDGGGGDGGNGGIAPTPVHEKTSFSNACNAYIGRSEGAPSPPVTPAIPIRPLPVDLETANADDLWRYGPGFVRLVGYQDGGGVVTSTDPAVVVDLARRGATLIGHNAYGFDVPALVRYHGLDLETVDVVDTKILASLADPPPSKLPPGEAERRYSLDTVGSRLLGIGKAGDLKALAREYGGYDRIPVDEPRYVEYVGRDVEITGRLAAEHFLPMSDYARREHEVARIAARIMLNGFRVDEDLLRQRIAEADARRSEMRAKLDHLGLPTTTKDGKKPCKAPLATEAGKAAVDAAFADLGVTLPRTESTNPQPSLGKETMQAIIDEGGPAAVLAETVQSLNGIRTIYEQVYACLADGRVHPTISFRQASGRWSVTKPGLTVVGKRKGRHVERDVFLPEPGHVIVAVDLAQIDARAVAVHSQDPNYLAMCEAGKDLHAEIAELIWGDRGRREDAKKMTHGFNYGEGPMRVMEEAGVSYDAAVAFLVTMAERFPLVVEWQNRVRDIAATGALLDNGFARMMRPTPDRKWTQAPALVGQGCARDLMMEGLLRLPHEAWPYLRGVIHDELILSAPVEIVDDVERTVVDAMSFEWAPAGASIPVAVVAEPSKRRGRNWGDVYIKEAK